MTRENGVEDATLRICMWCGPRNVSTALMYAWRQRSDTIVLDEPLYGHYLHRSGADHPGRDEVLAAMDLDGAGVIRDVILGPVDADVLFVKNMAHHLIDLDRSLFDGVVHAVLTRDPREMLPSLAARLPDPQMEDTGLVEQVEVLEAELAAGREPVVLEARELLRNPRSVLAEACRRFGLPFEEAMLSWPAGPKPEDGVWAPYWYDGVHGTTGFEPYRPKVETVPGRLESVLADCMPLYERLSAHAIRAEG